MNKKTATKIDLLKAAAIKVKKYDHGIRIVGLGNNERLYLLVWDDGEMSIGGHGNASSPTVEWALNHPYVG